MKKSLFIALLGLASTAVFAQDAPKKDVTHQKLRVEKVKLEKQIKLPDVELKQVQQQQPETQAGKTTSKKREKMKPVLKEDKTHPHVVGKKQVTKGGVE